MKIIHEVGKYVAIEKNRVERLRYNYSLPDDEEPSAPKPFIHPIRTPSGLEMTCESPLDHVWHRGVWFTWKFVNGVNYWEEKNDEFGWQVTLAPPLLQPLPTGENGTEKVRMTCNIEWNVVRDEVKTVHLEEEREIVFGLHPDGALIMDWHIKQTPKRDVILDRTPFTTWGGYGGVVARTTQAIQKQRIVFDDGTETNRPTGEPHLWGGIEGKLDTGQNHWAAFVFLPHPDNERYPEPFYGTAKPFFNFFGPAPLFHDPLTLERGQIFYHAVRVLALPRPIGPTEVNGYYEDWISSPEEAPLPPNNGGF